MVLVEEERKQCTLITPFCCAPNQQFAIHSQRTISPSDAYFSCCVAKAAEIVSLFEWFLSLTEATNFSSSILETRVKKSGEMFSPLTHTAGKNTVCTTGEITAQHRRVGPGALCTARGVASDWEEWPARPGPGPLCTQPNYNTLSALRPKPKHALLFSVPRQSSVLGAYSVKSFKFRIGRSPQTHG